MELALDTIASDLGADFQAWISKCDLQCARHGADARVRVPARVLRSLLEAHAEALEELESANSEKSAAEDRIAYLEQRLAEASAVKAG